jgi:hypothetical protein
MTLLSDKMVREKTRAETIDSPKPGHILIRPSPKLIFCRRESSQLLRVIWSSLLSNQPNFPVAVSLLCGDESLLHPLALAASSSIPTVQFFQLCSTFEGFLWILSVLLEVSIDTLCLDEDQEEDDDAGDDEDDGTDRKRHLCDDELGLLSVWWKISSDVTEIFSRFIPDAEGGSTLSCLPSDIVLSFLSLWKLFPQLLKPIEGECDHRRGTSCVNWS